MIRFLLALGISSTLAGPVLAQSVEERLIAGLTAQGYTVLEDGRTFLGRLRIVAENGTLHREIVANPSTGEILRDYVVALADLGRPAAPDRNSHGSNVAAVPTPAATAGSGATQPTISNADPVATGANPVAASNADPAGDAASAASLASAGPASGHGAARTPGNANPTGAAAGLDVTAAAGTVMQQGQGTTPMLILADPVVPQPRSAP